MIAKIKLPYTIVIPEIRSFTEDVFTLNLKDLDGETFGSIVEFKEYLREAILEDIDIYSSLSPAEKNYDYDTDFDLVEILNFDSLVEEFLVALPNLIQPRSCCAVQYGNYCSECGRALK